MATQESTRNLSMTAGADLSGSQYLFVKAGANKTVTVCSAITDVALGVLQNDPVSGLQAAVAVEGTAKVLSAAAVAVGARVAPSAAGKAQTCVSTQYPRGIALTACSNADEMIEIALISETVMA